jgi:hypothetical protein
LHEFGRRNKMQDAFSDKKTIAFVPCGMLKYSCIFRNKRDPFCCPHVSMRTINLGSYSEIAVIAYIILM